MLIKILGKYSIQNQIFYVAFTLILFTFTHSYDNDNQSKSVLYVNSLIIIQLIKFIMGLNKKIITCILIIKIMMNNVWASMQTQNSVIQNKKAYELSEGQTLNLNVNSEVKINLVSTKTSEKLHSIPYTIHQNIIESDQSKDDEADFNIFLEIHTGQALFYFTPSNGFQNALPAQNLKTQTEQLGNNSIYIRDYLKLAEGVNTIRRQGLKTYFMKQPFTKKLLSESFSILVIPKGQVKFSIKFGMPQYSVISIAPQKQTLASSSKSAKTIYVLQTQDDYVIRMSRKKGFPTIKIYECEDKIDCFLNQNIVPPLKSVKTQHTFLKFYLQSMLTKFEQFSGTKGQGCTLYLQVSSKQQDEGQIQVMILTPNQSILLKQNEILHEDIKSKSKKNYLIQPKKEEVTRVTVQVYEGEVRIQIKENNGTWKQSPTESTGVISVQLPSTRSFNLQIETIGGKDAKFSLVYSSGQYQIFIKDGYPTSHVLSPKKSITFLYYNQKLEDTPMYLSLNVNNSKAVNSLKMKIFYFNQTKYQSKTEYIPAKQHQLSPQTKSFIVQIPGNFPNLEAVFESTWSEPVEIAVTINDEQIIFLPLNHSLPLQIDKNGGVNLLIKNNEQGFIELTIKKCDESYPKIAYSLSPQDFMKQIYDYESLGDNQRITKSNIKVKKGGGLYIRISADSMTSSFLQITATFFELDHKKAANTIAIKKGNYGELNYQLITNSKAEIWFKQLQCSEQCQKVSRYQCYWSTSKSDMFRSMICPSIFMFKNSANKFSLTPANATLPIHTEGYKIVSKPGRDGIVSFKQILEWPIIYLAIKAINQQSKTQLIYKDIEIVTIAGQLSRMSTQFLFISIGIAIFITTVLFFVIRRQARLGYTAVNTSENQKKKKTKLDIIKG